MNSQRSQILQKRIQELIWYVARTGTTEIFSEYILDLKHRGLIDSYYQLMQDYKPFIIREAEKIK